MRIVLDTELWRDIADRNEGRVLEALAQRRGFKIIVPPLTLLDTLPTSNDELRRDITPVAAAMWLHTLPAAGLEAEEVISVFRQHRARWLRRIAIQDRVRTLKHFWNHRAWQGANDNPEALAAIRSEAFRHSRRGRLLQRQSERQIRMMMPQFRLPPGPDHLLTDLSSLREEQRRGWLGQSVAAWRVDIAIFFWSELFSPSNPVPPMEHGLTHREWIYPWVDLDAVATERESFNRLWYHEIAKSSVARNWMRRSIRWARTASSGLPLHPVDHPHIPYLFDCDVLVTADHAFIETVESVREDCPVPIAQLVTLDPRYHSVVQGIEAALVAASAAN